MKDLKQHRSQVLEQIKKQSTDTQGIEQEIFLKGCQLRMVMEENQKFEDVRNIFLMSIHLFSK